MGLKAIVMTSGTGRAKGFTFIEILLVIALIAIMAAISVPKLKKTVDDMQLQIGSDKLQAFIVYLRERSVVEGGIILLTIDTQKKEYWAQAQDSASRLKTYTIPGTINIETDKREVFFYPDGSIDKVTVKLSSPDKRTITLSTEGVYGGIKSLSQ